MLGLHGRMAASVLSLGLIGALSGPWHGGAVSVGGVFDRSTLSEPLEERRRVRKVQRQARRRAQKWEKG